MSTNPPQLYLSLPTVLSQSVVRDLQEALRDHAIACVLCQAPEPDRQIAAALCELCQSHDVAFLVQDDPALALELQTDGLHLGLEHTQDTQTYETAREALGKDAIIGAHCANRHEALILGELGADYIAFSAEEDLANLENSHIAWWADVVEVPCIAWNVAENTDIKTYTDMGADFVNLELNTLRGVE